MDFSPFRKHIKITGKQLSYLDIGQGPALLLGHGYLLDSTVWTPQLVTLSQHFRCIVPDLWGHGQSDILPEQCRSLLDISAHMLSLMDTLEITDFSIIGLGVGAIWGAELVLAAPARVNHLIMLGSFIGFEPEVTRAKYAAMLAKITATNTVPAEIIQALIPLYFAATNTELAEDKPQVASFAASLASMPAANISSVVALGQMIIARRDTMEHAEKFTLPCLIMVGVEDKLRSVLESYLMHDAIDGSELVHLAQTGHVPSLTQAAKITEKMQAFLVTS